MSDFYKYFKENMDGLGLPAPQSLFGSFQAAVGNATVILSQIDKFGKGVTLGELIGAGTRLEGLGVVAACSAAFYVGAVIGSIAVASGRALSGGASMADVLALANRYDLDRAWLTATLQRYPGIYKPMTASKNTYRYHSAVA